MCTARPRGRRPACPQPPCLSELDASWFLAWLCADALCDCTNCNGGYLPDLQQAERYGIANADCKKQLNNLFYVEDSDGAARFMGTPLYEQLKKNIVSCQARGSAGLGPAPPTAPRRRCVAPAACPAQLRCPHPSLCALSADPVVHAQLGEGGATLLPEPSTKRNRKSYSPRDHREERAQRHDPDGHALKCLWPVQ